MAQEESQSKLYDYLYSKYLMKEFTGISMSNDDFIEKSYLFYREIGDIATATHAFEAVIEKGRIDLPCNCEFIESVSTGQILKDEYDDLLVFYGVEDLQEATIVTNESSFLPDVIEDKRFRRHNLSRSQLHPRGELIPFEILGSGCSRYLNFDPRFEGVHIQVIYRGILLDEDKNPLITMKQAIAIAYKTAFMVIQKKAFQGDTISMNILSYIKPEAERKMAAAKIPEYLSQNFIDRLLSAKTRHDRKVFWSSYKTMQ